MNKHEYKYGVHYIDIHFAPLIGELFYLLLRVKMSVGAIFE